VRRLVVALVVVVGLLVAADRIAVVAAQDVVAKRIQREQGLLVRPDVTIGGFPFLTQAIAGTYDDVSVVLRDVRRGPVPVARITAHLRGVHVPLGDVVRQHLGQVPVDRASAAVLVTYAALDTWLTPRHLSVEPGPHGEVRVSGSVTVAGQTVRAAADGRLTVTRDAVVVTTGRGLDVTIPLPGLPFRIELLRARGTSDGIVVEASAAGLVLRTGVG
jgi:hypothetical protein